MSAHEQAPAFRSPAGGCDAHFHVFGRPEAYPYGDAKLRYQPPVATLDDYLEHSSVFGLEKFVFVQPSAYGRDNRCMLDAMKELRRRWGDAKYRSSVRGIVDIDDDCADEVLADMHALGVRGVRVNVSPTRSPEPGFSSTMIPWLERLDERLSELGWVLDFLTPGWLTQELIPTLRRLRVTCSLAHMGMFLAKDGPQQPGFRQLIDLVNDGDRRCWIKLTGAYRMGTGPDYRDSIPMAQAVLESAPDRVIWGSDWPHLSFADKVTGNQLWSLLGEYAPDEARRRRILVDNPGTLFDF